MCETIALVKGPTYDLVLGREFCCRFGTVIDDQAGVLRIGGLSIPLPLYTDIWPSRIRVMLAPLSQAAASVAVRTEDKSRIRRVARYAVAPLTCLFSFIFAVILMIFSRAGKMTGCGAPVLQQAVVGVAPGEGPEPDRV